MSFPAACCNTPPVQASYTPVGAKQAIGGIECYVSGSKDAKRGVIVNYDIFGMHANVVQLCDVLAAAGYYVVLPDLLGSDALTEAGLGNAGVFAAFIKGPGSWAAVKDKYVAVQGYLRDSGIEAVAVVGFCWGGKMVVRALAELDGLAGGAIVHPALIKDGDMATVRAPLLVLPSKDEPDFTAEFATLGGKPFFKQCGMVRFDDMHHGFCGARGDWSKPEQAKRVNDAVKLLVGFFNTTTASRQ
ncbi:hypothetical protein IWQ56_004079 [Coemansia nantahalensis]|uniref:Uncharacterized protein n=1 Tax=Coemansia nantahalensis TaxID=2789366 RepID=A0ACC1JUU6_9FUNG|nr:hypothetical protein IWQ56_004079 [Coemansia nantahalensis]KAJ2767726.1 hypothetical protein IWQ57_003837 [Coemansia nantahalensis]